MIRVKSTLAKKALAAALEEHDPEFLADLKMLAGAFGPMEEVGYESEDPEINEAAHTKVKSAVHGNAQAAIDAAKAALGFNLETRK